MRTFILLLALATASTVAAQPFSTTNVQVLHGAGFDDWHYGSSTENGLLSTVTLEHFTSFAYGDVFFFTDFTGGRFVDAEAAPIGQEHRTYGELALRLSPVRLLGGALRGPVRDLYVAGQLNRDGNGFSARMIGLGMDLNLPFVQVASLNVYLRDDLFNEPTYQVTAVWNAALSFLPWNAALAGFVDVAGTDALGTDVLTQPQLLLRPGGGPLAFGTELYVHVNDVVEVVAPQVLLTWTLQ